MARRPMSSLLTALAITPLSARHEQAWASITTWSLRVRRTVPILLFHHPHLPFVPRHLAQPETGRSVRRWRICRACQLCPAGGRPGIPPVVDQHLHDRADDRSDTDRLDARSRPRAQPDHPRRGDFSRNFLFFLGAVGDDRHAHLAIRVGTRRWLARRVVERVRMDSAALPERSRASASRAGVDHHLVVDRAANDAVPGRAAADSRRIVRGRRA